MANRYVRIYAGEGSDIVGFSASASDVPDDPECKLFMAGRGHVTEDVEAPAGSTSLRHLEVRPPMSKAHLRQFSRLCQEIIDPGNNQVLVLDNRGGMPTEPYEPASVIPAAEDY